MHVTLLRGGTLPLSVIVHFSIIMEMILRILMMIVMVVMEVMMVMMINSFRGNTVTGVFYGSAGLEHPNYTEVIIIM